MDYEHKHIEMQQYLPLLQDMLERIKKTKANDPQASEYHEKNLAKFQLLFNVLTNKNKKLSVGVLRSLEELIKKFQPLIEKENLRQIAREAPKRDHNGPHHKRKPYDETPASPSPPDSPVYNSTVPIQIPSERQFDRNFHHDRRYRNESPPPPRFNRPPTPEPTLKTVPIPVRDVEEEGPLEWDLPEDETPQRPEIVIGRPDVADAAKRLGDKFQKKDYQHGRNERQDSKDRYDSNKDRYDLHKDRYDSNKDRYDTNKDRYDNGKDRYDSGKDRYDSGKDRYDPIKDRYEPNKDRYESNRDRDRDRDRYDSNKDRFGRDRDRFEPKDRYDPIKDRFEYSKDHRRSQEQSKSRYDKNCENIPTVEIPSLGGSRRMASVIERNNLLSSDNISRYLPNVDSNLGLDSPDINVPDEHLSSPDPSLFTDSPSPPRDPRHFHQPTQPPLPPSPSKPAPPPPTLLLKGPQTAKPPLSLDDLAEFLPTDHRREKPLTASSRPVQGASRILSPRSEHSSPSPLTDPRTSNLSSASIPPLTDPRLRNQPQHAAPTMVPAPVPPPAPTDPRTQPRLADNYERYKRVSRDPQQPVQPQIPQPQPPQPMYVQPQPPIPQPQPQPNMAYPTPMDYQAQANVLAANMNMQQWAMHQAGYQVPVVPQMPIYPQPPQPHQRNIPPTHLGQYNQYPQHYEQQQQVPMPVQDPNQYQRPRPQPWGATNNANNANIAVRSQTNPAHQPRPMNKDPRDPRSQQNDFRTVKPAQQKDVPQPPKPVSKEPVKEVHHSKLPSKPQDKNKDKEKDKDKDKELKSKKKSELKPSKSKDKSSSSDAKTKTAASASKSQVYGTVNAKAGFNNFKIPKKKTSVDTEPEDVEPTPVENDAPAPEPSANKDSLEFIVENLRTIGRSEEEIRKFTTAYKLMQTINEKDLEKEKQKEKEKAKEKEKDKEKSKEKVKEKAGERRERRKTLTSSEDEIVVPKRNKQKKKLHKAAIISDESEKEAEPEQEPKPDSKKKRKRTRLSDTSDAETKKAPTIATTSKRRTKEVKEKESLMTPPPILTPEVSAEPKRHNRELEMLHKDLDSSFIKDSIESYSNKRQCNSRRMNLNEDALQEQNQGKKARGKRAKTPVPKKTAENFECILEDDSAKVLDKQTEKMFDDSDNDDFSLDPSVLENATDISLHQGNKQRSDAESEGEAEGEEEEETESVASSKNTEEQELDSVYDALAKKGAKGAGRGRGKKKRNSWRLGIAKKKKKTVTKRSEEQAPTPTPVVAEAVANNEESNSIDEQENEHDDDILAKVDLNALIAYTWSPDQDKYQCLLCQQFIKNIVHHYKSVHKNKEMLISRLPVAAADCAIAEAEALDHEQVDEGGEFTRYSCRFCRSVFRNLASGAKEHFYEHCTHHTGEYRYGCLACGYSAITKTSIRSHYYKGCRKPGTSSFAESTFEDLVPVENRIYGYICTKCNFVQLKRSNVDKHMKTWHIGDPGAKMVKISMSQDVKDESVDQDTSVSKMVKREAKREVKDELNSSQLNLSQETPESEVNVVMEAVIEKTEEKPSGAGNLSAFVVPAELENKEAEIQMERRKKMQEIAENIGITSKRSKEVSVADKLKDKIVQQQEEAKEKRNKERTTEVVEEPVKVKDEPQVEENKSKEKSKKTNSEEDDSEQEMAPLQYDSESSSESDDHLNNQQADVDEPLNDQSNVMSGTIQKLMARMQNKAEEVKIKTEPDVEPEKRKLDDDDEKENADVMPPAKIKKENEEEEDKADEKEDAEKPRIRLRRISGDKLSKGPILFEEDAGQSQNEPEPMDTTPAVVTNLENDGCLKIASVVSLAPQTDSDTLAETRKSVETSPSRSKGQSLLKKPGPLFIKRVDGETLKLIPIVAPNLSRPVSSSEGSIVITTQPISSAVTLRLDSQNRTIPLNVSVSNSGAPATIVNTTGQSLKLVKLPESTFAVKLKSKVVYEKMLQDDKLVHLFKCMGRDCSFTSSVEQAFNKHVRIHEETFEGGQGDQQAKDFYKCAYCYNDCKGYKDLISHLTKMHTYCRYCCKYCFYRGLNSNYVEIHQRNIHQGQKINILTIKEELVHKVPPLVKIDRKQVIRPFVCVHDCNKYFFIPEAFILHLNLHHQSITTFKCHVCLALNDSVDALIEHYKKHNFCKYHCMWCTYGGSTTRDLHNHMSAAHYNMPPEILERCLPKEILKNVSAIDQLKIINLDQVYQPDELKSPTGQTMTPIVVSPMTQRKLATSTRGFTTLASLRPANLDGNMTIRIADGTSNVRLIDPRSLSSVLTPRVTTSVQGDGTDEFVSINLLENPDLLNKKSNKSVNLNTPAVLTKIPATATEDDDSDIEIIEDFNAESEGNVTKDSEQSFAEEISNAPLVISDSKKPLTLDDIENTGFTGLELYRCGINACQFRAANQEGLRKHLSSCFKEKDPLYCKVCKKKKPYLKISSYLEHVKTHGIKRFGCSICEARFAQQTAAQNHIRLKHLIKNYTVVPADPTNPAQDGLYVVKPMSNVEKFKSKKSKTDKEASALPSKIQPAEVVEKLTYGPGDIDSLPYQAIYGKAIQCAVCSYSNKVRTNIVRHLQLHAKDESVPESGPVNPVPCLEKKEKMFDKMVNLASSSHQNGRMGGSKSELVNKTPEDESYLPKYVPENQRYVCGVPECNYLSVDEIMLRCHLKALHSDEIYFRCPHCPPPNGQDIQNIAIDKMGIHLKMHDIRLYKCTHCTYHHCHRHVVERHLTDKHSEKRPFVKVIRELEGAETQTSIVESTETEESICPDGNVWKCNMCDYKCVKKADAASHAASKHGEKYQYKCNLCPFRSIGKYTFETHLNTNHADVETDYTVIYERIAAPAKKDPVEPISQDEPFDTTPLWRRDMPRIRHIRGILLEEDDGRISESKPKSSPTKAGKVRSKSGSLDDTCMKSPDAKKVKTEEESIKTPSRSRLKLQEIVLGDNYGEPVGDLYTCIFCKNIQTKYKHDLRDHIFREVQYQKWPCTLCDFKTVNRSILLKHYHLRHPMAGFDAVAHVDETIEDWVATYLKHQGDMIKENAAKQSQDNSVEDIQIESESPLVIAEVDCKMEEPAPEEEEEEVKDVTKDVKITCKHCAKVFHNVAGFKRHVTVQHSRSLPFQCPYCDRTSNQEHIIVTHLKSQHRDKPCVVNKVDVPKPQSTDFWEDEYGLKSSTGPSGSGASSKKRKRDSSPSQIVIKVEPEAPVSVSQESMDIPISQSDHLPVSTPATDLHCRRCGFEATNLAALRVHSQNHAVRVRQQCTLCTFKTCDSSEMRQHWDINHGGREFRVEEALLMAEPVTPPGGTAGRGHGKKSKAHDEDSDRAMIYSCYYCQISNFTVDGIRRHHKEAHKDHKDCQVFRYMEDPDSEAKCAYCADAGTKSEIAVHINRFHPDKELRFVDKEGDGWQCQICKVFLSDRTQIGEHQANYHEGQKASCRLVTKYYDCKHCKFETYSTEVMRNHVTTYHMLIYHCEICPERFSVQGAINIHYRKQHPGVEPNYRRDIKEDVIHREIEETMRSCIKITEPTLRTTNLPSFLASQKRPLISGVAKKSTTKQTVKAVAKKSTNPNLKNRLKPLQYVSHYGRARSPVDLTSIRTSMTMGTGKISITCDRLATVFDIDCKVLVEDILKKANT